MSEFLLVFGIALLASFLTYLGAPAAERFDARPEVISGALQFAAGIISALVAFSLMPPAVRSGPYAWVVLAFFLGGVLYVTIEYLSTRVMASAPAAEDGPTSFGLYIGILVDLVIDGVVIGIGSTLTLATGLLLALGLAISTAPLAFMTTATAKRQGMSQQNRRRLSFLFFLCVLAGALLGYLVLRNQSQELRLILVALASGFLITTVVQGLIPEANREGEPGFAGVLYVAGLSLYGLMSLIIQ
jgi:ZIP family zinc transporter